MGGFRCRGTGAAGAITANTSAATGAQRKKRGTCASGKLGGRGGSAKRCETLPRSAGVVQRKGRCGRAVKTRDVQVLRKSKKPRRSDPPGLHVSLQVGSEGSLKW